MNSVELVLFYIKVQMETNGKRIFNKKYLSSLLGVGDRQVREAFYKHKDFGITVTTVKGNIIVIDNTNYEQYRDLAMKEIARDRKIALKKLWRSNKQMKAIPVKDQMKIEEMIKNEN